SGGIDHFGPLREARPAMTNLVRVPTTFLRTMRPSPEAMLGEKSANLIVVKERVDGVDYLSHKLDDRLSPDDRRAQKGDPKVEPGCRECGATSGWTEDDRHAHQLSAVLDRQDRDGTSEGQGCGRAHGHLHVRSDDHVLGLPGTADDAQLLVLGGVVELMEDPEKVPT